MNETRPHLSATRPDPNAIAPVVLRSHPARPQALDCRPAQGQHRRNRSPALSRLERTQPTAHAQRQPPATARAAAARGVLRLQAPGAAFPASGDRPRRAFAQDRQPLPGAAKPLGDWLQTDRHARSRQRFSKDRAPLLGPGVATGDPLPERAADPRHRAVLSGAGRRCGWNCISCIGSPVRISCST